MGEYMVTPGGIETHTRDAHFAYTMKVQIVFFNFLDLNHTPPNSGVRW